MGAVTICKQQCAKNPYYVETTGVRLYSVEELAYYLYENIYLIDDKWVGDSLYTWLEQELQMKTLSEQLRRGEKEDVSIYHQVMKILETAEYHEKEELEAFSEKINAISGLQTQERMKYKADEYVHNENYWEAVTEYENILSIRQSTRLDVEFYGRVWNNLGACYARLFLFAKASECFEKAYSFHKIQEYKKKAEYAAMLEQDPKAVADAMEQRMGSLPEIENQEVFLRDCEKKYLKNSYS